MSQALATTNLSLPSVVGSLDAYISAVHRIPVLSQDEEQALSRRYNEEEDLASAKQLVMSHLRFVVHVARGYSGYGLQLADLIQEGNIGLMKAVKRFDPDQGVRLVSFAVHWIRAEMHEFILKNWRIVKVATTKAQRKLFFNLRKSKKRLGWMNAAEVRAVAQDLGVPEATVREMDRACPAATSASRRRRMPTTMPSPRRRPSWSTKAPIPTTTWPRPTRATTCSARCPVRWASWTSVRATSSSAAGWTRTRPRCRNWPTSTASPPSASARSRRTR